MNIQLQTILGNIVNTNSIGEWLVKDEMGKSVQRKYCCLVGTCSCCGFIAVVLSVVAVILVLLYPSFMRNRIQQVLYRLVINLTRGFL